MRYASVDCQYCSAELSNANASPADPELIALQTQLIDSLSNCPDAKLSDMSFEQVASLIKHIGQFGSGFPKRRSGQIAGLHRLEIASKLLIRAAHLLSDWPRHFYQALTEVRMSVTPSASLKRTYGHIYRAIYSDLHDPCFQFLRDAFDNYVRTDWPNLVARRNRRLSAKTIAHQSRKPLRVLTRESGMSKASVRRLADNGLIEGSYVRHASGRTTWAFSAGATQQAREISEDRIDLAQTAKLLGIPKWRVRELIDASMITTWIRADTTKASAWSLSRKSVFKIFRLGQQRQSADTISTSKVSLLHVMQTWRLRNREFPGIIDACLSHRIACWKPVGSDPCLGCLLFERSDLRAWLDQFRIDFDECYSIDQAARELGVKQQVAYELVRRGLLAYTECDNKAERGARVLREAIRVFQREFVSLKELSKSHGVGVRKLLSALSCPPICGPTIDGARQYFYRRLDL